MVPKFNRNFVEMDTPNTQIITTHFHGWVHFCIVVIFEMEFFFNSLKYVNKLFKISRIPLVFKPDGEIML